MSVNNWVLPPRIVAIDRGCAGTSRGWVSSCSPPPRRAPSRSTRRSNRSFSGKWPTSSYPLNERFERRELRLRSEEHTSELQSRQYLVCRLLLEKKQVMTISDRVVVMDYGK